MSGANFTMQSVTFICLDFAVTYAIYNIKCFIQHNYNIILFTNILLISISSTHLLFLYFYFVLGFTIIDNFRI